MKKLKKSGLIALLLSFIMLLQSSQLEAAMLCAEEINSQIETEDATNLVFDSENVLLVLNDPSLHEFPLHNAQKLLEDKIRELQRENRLRLEEEKRLAKEAAVKKKEEELQQFEVIIRSTEKELYDSSILHLEEMGYEPIKVLGAYEPSGVPGVIYAEGNVPILISAHLDTVHWNLPGVNEDIYDEVNGIFSSYNGIGGDDRCGVFAARLIIERLAEYGIRPYVMFCEKEEWGCTGTYNALPYIERPDLKFLIGLDRRGGDLACFYGCTNPEFRDYILNEWGYEQSFYGLTDIVPMGQRWDIASVNLSVGYYLLHTLSEYIVVEELYQNVDKIVEIIKADVNQNMYFDYYGYNNEIRLPEMATVDESIDTITPYQRTRTEDIIA